MTHTVGVIQLAVMRINELRLVVQSVFKQVDVAVLLMRAKVHDLQSRIVRLLIARLTIEALDRVQLAVMHTRALDVV